MTFKPLCYPVMLPPSDQGSSLQPGLMEGKEHVGRGGRPRWGDDTREEGRGCVCVQRVTGGASVAQDCCPQA